MKTRLKKLVFVYVFTVGILSGTSYTVTAQTTDCSAQLEVSSQRLLKTLDALEKAEALIGFKDKEIAARVNLENLYKQAIEVKDLIIKFQDELIRKLQKPNSGFMGRLKSILKTVERVILVAAGVYVGRL